MMGQLGSQVQVSLLATIIFLKNTVASFALGEISPWFDWGGGLEGAIQREPGQRYWGDTA